VGPEDWHNQKNFNWARARVEIQEFKFWRDSPEGVPQEIQGPGEEEMKANYKTALIGGLLVGILPAWAVSFIAETYPSLKPEDLGVLTEFMSNGIGITQIIFFAIIVFLIPPLEELVFRGGLWRLLEWRFSSYWTWIIVSVIFASIHMELLHVLGLLPFSFFVGWLRYKTGDINLSVLAHVANNAVGCLLMML